eukprot:365975-Rhodomonas_salina.1
MHWQLLGPPSIMITVLMTASDSHGAALPGRRARAAAAPPENVMLIQVCSAVGLLPSAVPLILQPHQPHAA